VDAGQLLFLATFGAGAVLGVALALGIKNWRSPGGKVAAIAAGVALAGLIAVVALVVLAALILPPVIALP